jgi:beta-phosphoglucomutase family hydrolase
MNSPTLHHRISKDRFDAILFDLDGVLTATAKIHASCWKTMFDAFLTKRAEEGREPFSPFDITVDYQRYVDGKLRYEGVRSFLESRGIDLPCGASDDPLGHDTICGLGNLKDELVKQAIEKGPVETYPGGVALARHALSLGMKTAVVSASKNCRAVLRAANIEHLFHVRVDGELAERLNIPGKPAPDTFFRAAAILEVDPQRAVVVEDAISGVIAGRAGGFGLVIGVDRKGSAAALIENGADFVVTDLGELIG